MNEKRWWLGIAGGGALLALGLGGLIYMQHGKIETARTDVAGLQTQIESARQLIEGTTALEREVIVLREVSEVMKAILPDEEDVNNLVRTFQEFSGSSGVQITGLKKKRETPNKGSGFDMVGYTLSLAAETFQLLDFLDSIESHSRFMRVPTFKITAASRNQINADGVAAHRVQLDVETFVYDPGKNAQPVKIEGYERKRDLLMGEINRRREALTVTNYTYRGPRGRRDPWIDPRVPINGDAESALTVQEQMDIVQDLANRMQAAVSKFEDVENAENVILEMMTRAELEEDLAGIEEEVRRYQSEGSIRYVPSERRLQLEVVDVLEDLRTKLAQSDVGRGPTEAQLKEVHEAMLRHMELAEYDLMLDAFRAVEDRLAVISEAEPVRYAYVERLRYLARIAQTVSDFDKVPLDIMGTTIIEGKDPVVVINGKSLGLGDLVNDELVVHAISAEEVEFLFRGVILARRF